jgi:hypothetical protein
MNDGYAQALVDALVEQRNSALDALAKCRAELSVMRSLVESMKKAEEPATGG